MLFSASHSRWSSFLGARCFPGCPSIRREDREASLPDRWWWWEAPPAPSNGQRRRWHQIPVWFEIICHTSFFTWNFSRWVDFSFASSGLNCSYIPLFIFFSLPPGQLWDPSNAVSPMPMQTLTVSSFRVVWRNFPNLLHVLAWDHPLLLLFDLMNKIRYGWLADVINPPAAWAPRCEFFIFIFLKILQNLFTIRIYMYIFVYTQINYAK